MMELRLAWRQVLGNRRFATLFLLNLTLGLSGFVALDAFKHGLERSLSARSKSVLGADLSVSVRRPLTPEEEKAFAEGLPTGSEVRRGRSLYSMVAVPGASRLVNLKSVTPGYPFYGDLLLTQGGRVDAAKMSELEAAPKVWVFPELLLALKLKLGDTLRLGERDFTIVDTIESDPTNLWTGATLAPRIYLGPSQLDQTGLVQKGSTIWHRAYVRLPPGEVAEEVAERLQEGIPDPGVRFVTHRGASQQLGRLLAYLNDYLGLVALVAMFLSAVGGAFLYRSFLGARLGEVAVLLSLGNSAASTLRIFFLQLLFLGVLAAVLALGVGWGLVPVVRELVGALLPVTPDAGWAWSTVGVALGAGVGASALVCLPFLLTLLSLKPRLLFDSGPRELPTNRWARLAWVVPLVAFWLLAMWQSHSVAVGSAFTVAFLGSGAMLYGLGALGLMALGRLRFRRWEWRLSLRALVRHRAATLSCFLAIGLGNLLVNLIPQVQGGLNEELENPPGTELPSLFLFDIQEDQVAELDRLARELGHPLGQVSATVRARVRSVNGEPFVRAEDEEGTTREDQQERRMRNRGMNLTYRDGLSPSESLYSGKPFSATPQDPPEISVEVRYADRMGWGLGDEIVFDVQGVEVPGKIRNLRRVRWTSFQPNFFVSFGPGVLEGAPKTFLASVSGLNSLDQVAFQNQIVSRFPNVSVIDVGRLVERLLGIVAQMAWAMRFMALLSLAAGLAVLFSIASHQAKQRQWDMNLLKLLGASRQGVGRLFLFEFLTIGFCASVAGAGGSLVAGYGLSFVLFDALWKANWWVPVLSVVTTCLLCVGVTWLAGRSVFRSRILLHAAN